ncbi:MAG: sugar ABC transporter permease YjfF [Steroidobacteraceae bacterium]|nr:sugar ABC transporter permease YjfF [Steroidobacteraceae bacterium]
MPAHATTLLGLDRRIVPLTATLVLFVALIVFGAASYDSFLAPQVFLNLAIDNAFLCIVAVGMTFVILTGGIDLSVGSVLALTTMAAAALTERAGWSPWLVMPLLVVAGGAFGAAQGFLIHRYRLQPFIVTLAGMFVARGLCYLIDTESIPINDPAFVSLAQARIPLGGGNALSSGAAIAIAIVLVALWAAHATRFGRTVYAIGGSAKSAALMGLPVGSTLVRVYALSGACAALAGLVMSIYMLSGYSLHAVGLELDAIAAVVIGGTLLTGGVGYVAGTVVGVLILGIIQTLVIFNGTLSSWWTRIVIGILLFLFCLSQRLIEGKAEKT